MSKNIGIKKRIALELFRKLHKDRVKQHELNTLFWECTLRCNLSCLHCGSDCRSLADQPDMPMEDFFDVIHSILPHVNPNKILIIFTGGEALVRKDIEACGLELYRQGFPWGIVTNGMLLTRKRLDSLLASGMHTLTLSLDGFEEPHNWLRGHPQSFTKASNALDMLTKEKELIWDVVTCVNRKNIDSLNEFRTYLIDKGVKKWRIFTIFPVGRAATYPELQLDNEQFTYVLDFIKETRAGGEIELSYGCEGFLGGYEMEVRDNFYSCHAGVNVASILANGAISGCPSIRANFYQGNIYKDNFMDVWNNRFEKFRNRDWCQKGECADCNLFRYCKGNGMHLYDDNEKLLICHHKRISEN